MNSFQFTIWSARNEKSHIQLEFLGFQGWKSWPSPQLVNIPIGLEFSFKKLKNDILGIEKAKLWLTLIRYFLHVLALVNHMIIWVFLASEKKDYYD